MEQYVPAGSGPLRLFQGTLAAGDSIELPTRHLPQERFSLTIYQSGVVRDRFSVCCLAKAKPGSRIGGPGGLFKLAEVRNAKPCLQCQVTMLMDNPEGAARLGQSTSEYGDFFHSSSSEEELRSGDEEDAEHFLQSSKTTRPLQRTLRPTSAHVRKDRKDRAAVQDLSSSEEDGDGTEESVPSPRRGGAGGSEGGDGSVRPGSGRHTAEDASGGILFSSALERAKKILERSRAHSAQAQHRCVYVCVVVCVCVCVCVF